MSLSRQSRLSSYLLPSLADTLFISLLVALAFGSPTLRLLNDPGIGWHICTGEWILQNHAVPHSDLFSNVARPWFAWEWLFEIGVAKVHSWAGLNGVLAAGAALIALTFALLFRLTLQRGASLVTTVLFVVLSALASTVHCLARPHLFTWFFTLLCWYLLEVKRATVWVWAIPAIVLLWVNIHGGFLVAFALLGLTLAGETWEIATSAPDPARRRDFLRLAFVAIASFAASLANPYGISLYVHIYRYLSDPFLMHHIQEMQSPDFHTFNAMCFAALVLLAACVAITKRHRLRISQSFVLIFFAYAALSAVRNTPIACIVLTLTAAPLLNTKDDALPRPSRLRERLRGSSQRMGALELNSRGHAWAIVFAIITVLACANGGKFLGRQLLRGEFNGKKFPLRAVAFLELHPIPGPLFTTDAWSGFIIYREWPRLRVVVDDRHDMYGAEFMKNYLKIIEGQPDWKAQLEATGANSVLVPSTSATSTLLHLTPDWKLTYDDGQAALFERLRGAQ